MYNLRNRILPKSKLVSKPVSNSVVTPKTAPGGASRNSGLNKNKTAFINTSTPKDKQVNSSSSNHKPQGPASKSYTTPKFITDVTAPTGTNLPTSITKPPSNTPARISTSLNDNSKSSPSSSPLVLTPSQYDSSKLVNVLKKLNTDLLHRVKNLEDELNSTKLKYKELMSNSIGCNKTVEVDCSGKESDVPSNDPAAENIICNTAYLSNDETFTNTSPPRPSKPRVLVYGDSMTRGFGTILQQLLPEYLVQCNTFPGASFAFVIKDLAKNAATFTKEDIVFIMAGSNDVPFLTPQRLDQELEKLSRICLKTNVIISGIPYKFHLTKHNMNIFASNQTILNRSFVYNYFYFESNFFLSRNMYTEHGMHLNLRGKIYYNEMLHKAILSVKHSHTNSRFLFLLPNFIVENYNLECLDNTHSNRLLTNVSCPILEEVSLIENSNSVSSDVTSLIVPNSFFP